MSMSIKERFFKGDLPDGARLAAGRTVARARGSNALKPSYTEEDQLYTSIDRARYDLELAVKTFNELTDDKAIDYASYNLLAARARYSYLLKLAKEKGLSI